MICHKLRDENLWLLPEKCIFWEDQKCLLISDLHLGKIDHFRKYGSGLPEAAGLDNFNRLNLLILEYKPQKVFFLGDLFHSSMNADWLRFEKFISAFSKISFELIIGNHDILGKKHFSSVLKKVHQGPLVLGPFILSHEPLNQDDIFNLCGHIHPAVKLSGIGRQTIALPCFAFTSNTGILPAFGTFTGSHHIDARDYQDLFLIADKRVVRFKQ